MMRFPNGRKSISTLVVGFAILCFGDIPAAEICVNSPRIHDFASLSVARQADYRLSSTGFDQRLNNGGPVSVGANNITPGLGNLAVLNSWTCDLTLEFRAATAGVYRGFIWSPGGTGSSGVLARGVCDPSVPPPSTVWASFNSVTSSASFNAITIARRALSTAGTGS